MRPEFSTSGLAELEHVDLRAVAVEAAMVWRNCALSSMTTPAGRRACRTLMQVQAREWRRLTARQHRERRTDQ